MAVRLGASPDAIGYVIVSGLVALAALPWIADTFHERSGTVWIEHPELAGELKAEFERRQAEKLG